MKKIIILLCVISLLVSCKKNDDKNSKTNTAVQEKVSPVNVIKVEPSEIKDYYQTVGISWSDKKVKLASFNGGLVEKLYFENGDFVKKGTKMAEIDLQLYKVKLNKFLADFEKVKAEYEKDKKLYSKKAISKIAYISSKSNYESLIQDIEQIKIYLERAIIRAPFDCYVTAKSTEENEILSQGQVIYVIDKMDKLKVKFEVPQVDISKFRENELEITFDAYPEKVIKSKITQLSKEVNFKNLTFEAESEIDNSDYFFKSGLLARIKILKQIINSAVVIPKDAVLDYEDGHKIFILGDDNRVKLQPIELGVFEGKKAQILKGLNIGETIVVKGQQDLFDNDKVKVEVTK